MEFKFPEGIQKILQRLNDHGFEAYVVGGAIRDILMGLKPSDYDITTNAKPDMVMDIFNNVEGYTTKFVDAESYKVVSVNGVEIATYRKDIHENGKTIDTVTVDTLQEDLKRRDFTINAMAVGLAGFLHDHHGGQRAIEFRTIRFVGNPNERIIEDPNRILRAARFAAKTGFKIQKDSLEAMRAHRKKVDTSIAAERIRLEIIKTMKTCKRGSNFFTVLADIDALKYIFPSLDATMDVDGGKQHRETVWEHSLLTGDYMGEHYAGKCRENPMLRLAGYLHDVGKSKPNFKDGDIHFYKHETKGAEMVEEEMTHLTFVKKEIAFVKNMILLHMNGNIKMSPKSTRKLLVKLKKSDLTHIDWIIMREADRASNLAKEPINPTKINKLYKKFEHELNPATGDGSCPTSMKELAISGTQIQELLGIGPSQIVGVILQYLFDRTVMDPSLNTPEKLKEMVIGKKKNYK